MSTTPSRAARRAPLPRPLRLIACAVLVLYPLAAGVLLLTADGWAVNRANVRVWWFVTSVVGGRSVISPEHVAGVANVLLFVPFFAALAVLVPCWWWVLVGSGASTAVELYQSTLSTREASAWDVLANTLGALIGVVLGIALRSRWGRR